MNDDVALSRTNDTTVTGEAYVDPESRRFVTTGGCLREDRGRLRNTPVIEASQLQPFRTKLTASRSAIRNRLKLSTLNTLRAQCTAQGM